MTAELFIQSSAIVPKTNAFQIALSDGTSRLEIIDRHVYLNGTEITETAARRIRDAASDYFMHAGEEMTGSCSCPTNTRAAGRILLEALEPYRR